MRNRMSEKLDGTFCRHSSTLTKVIYLHCHLNRIKCDAVDRLQSTVPIIGTAVLRSAWIELDSLVQGVMRQPLLKFLKRTNHFSHKQYDLIFPLEFPQSWTLDISKDTEDHEVSDSDADSDAEKETLPKDSSSLPAKGASPAYEEFLGFLRSGCSGSPVEGYPTVLIIVSTIPSSVSCS
jgi:hypothetical protein